MPSPSYTIRHLLHGEIDKKKWDDCVRLADSPLIYASALYLDRMCPHWDALVMNDYEAVMPLPWNRKWGIRYVYSPWFVIGGGVFGKHLTANVVLSFINAIPHQFKYIDLDLNETNFYKDELEQNSIHFKTRTNTLLSLQEGYKMLYANYGALAKRKLKKAAQSGFDLTVGSDANMVIDLYCRYYKTKDSVITKFNFSGMVSLLQGALKNNTKTYLLSFPNGEVCAFYLLLFDERYVYWLIGGSTGNGKEAGAFYYLTDQVIQSFAGTDRIFRFEGSDQAGIQFFNRQFGGREIHYSRLTMNRLPPLLRLLKR